MNRDFQKARALSLLMVFGLAVAPALAGGATGKGKTGGSTRARPTTEPAPPLSLGIRLVNLQKHVSGGIASISFDATASVNLGEVDITARTPAEVTFTDGSRSKSFNCSLGSGGTCSLPADLLVSRDGKFVISADATASYKGKPVHRGTAFKLLVGVEERLPKEKDGAIEFQGAPGDGGI